MKFAQEKWERIVLLFSFILVCSVSLFTGLYALILIASAAGKWTQGALKQTQTVSTIQIYRGEKYIIRMTLTLTPQTVVYSFLSVFLWIYCFFFFYIIEYVKLMKLLLDEENVWRKITMQLMGIYVPKFSFYKMWWIYHAAL